MKCTFCGNEMEEGVKYCPVCGTEAVRTDNHEDQEQPAPQYEDPNKQIEYGGQEENRYNEPEGSQNGYGYGQGGYIYGSPDYSQNGYTYGGSAGGQNGNDQSQYGNNQGGYSYGQPGNGYSQPDYGQQTGYYSQPDNGYSQPVKPINGTPYLIFSILSTICCCLPLGIVSIIFASKIDSLQRIGDYAGAENAAKKAKIFMIVGAVLGIISCVAAGALGVYDAFEELGRADTPILSSPLDDEDEYDEDKSVSPVPAPAEASEDLGESWRSYTVQVNDVVLTFPCSIEEVEASGLMMDAETTPEDYVINKNDYELVFFEDDDYHSLVFVVSNNAEEAHAVRECTVNGIYVSDYDVEDGVVTVIFPGNIQMGTDISTVFEKWGEPDDSYEGDYSDSYTWYDGDGMNYCMVSVDPDTDKVITIDLDGQTLK
ncbi:MAG: zinc-ribbon domain-containing protein [Dorea sp.]|nr:zinc-ribbon domain-containing protein [Dorea sp.]